MRYPCGLPVLVVGLAAACLFAGGCGGPQNVTAVGSVLRGGQPIALSPTGVLQVTLKPDVGPDVEFTTYVGRCDKSGKFEIFEVPPGKYRIGIEQLDPTPQDDKLSGTMTVNYTKIVRDIDGKAPVVIDLTQLGAAKQSP